MTEKDENEISLKGMFSLALVKKERFCGSHGKMRYMLCTEDGKLKANIYPEPYCWEATPDEQKEAEFFEFSDEGIQSAVEWLNRMYCEKYR